MPTVPRSDRPSSVFCSLSLHVRAGFVIAGRADRGGPRRPGPRGKVVMDGGRSCRPGPTKPASRPAGGTGSERVADLAAQARVRFHLISHAAQRSEIARALEARWPAVWATANRYSGRVQHEVKVPSFILFG